MCIRDSKYWGQYTALGDTFLENLQGLTTLKIYQADGFKNEEMNRESVSYTHLLAVSSPTMAAAFDTPFEEMYMDDLLCNLFISKPELIDTIDNADKYLPTYDKSALRYEIDYSKSLDELDYTVESWRNLIDTVDIAQVKYDGDSITTEEITEQIGLVPVSYTHLNPNCSNQIYPLLKQYLQKLYRCLK